MAAANSHPYLRPWLDNRQLEHMALDIARVRDRLAAARQHYQWAVSVRALLPDEHALHLEKAYDSIRAAAGGLVRAHSVRGRGSGKSHEVALDVAVACLRARRPDAGAMLAPLATSIRVRRNRIQYESVEIVTREDCEKLFAVLSPVLEAIEGIAYELIGLPPPGGWQQAT